MLHPVVVEGDGSGFAVRGGRPTEQGDLLLLSHTVGQLAVGLRLSRTKNPQSGDDDLQRL
jgi:hypothetical protein